MNLLILRDWNKKKITKQMVEHWQKTHKYSYLCGKLHTDHQAYSLLPLLRVWSNFSWSWTCFAFLCPWELRRGCEVSPASGREKVSLLSLRNSEVLTGWRAGGFLTNHFSLLSFKNLSKGWFSNSWVSITWTVKILLSDE